MLNFYNYICIILSMFTKKYSNSEGYSMERDNMLNFLKRIADGLAVMFGKNCEVVIHDMENDDSSILYITNKHVTQREIGDKLDLDRKSTRLNSSHVAISYAVFCLKKKKKFIYNY